MVYRIVSSNEVIARVSNDFNPDYEGWVNRSPQWIADALDELEIYIKLEPVKECIDVVDYKFQLPCDIKLLQGIKYHGRRLPRHDAMNELDTCDLHEEDELRHHKAFRHESYELSNTGWGTTTFREGEITIYYKRVPVELDATTGIYFPLIPDNQYVKMAIEWYILRGILLRGHIHTVVSLDSKNPETNPGAQWELYKKRARNSVGAMDADERAEVSNILRTFIVNKRYVQDEAFNDIARRKYTHL
jgi:hypothetical protein